MNSTQILTLSNYMAKFTNFNDHYLAYAGGTFEFFHTLAGE